MKKNRSIPDVSVIPVLIYPDVREAVAWLTVRSGSPSGCGSAGTTARSYGSAMAAR